MIHAMTRLVLAAMLLTPSIICAEERKPNLNHDFWDRQNISLIAASAAGRAMDVHTTHRFLHLGGNERLMPERFVRNTKAFSLYSAGAVAATSTFMWVAHRKHHHRLERAIGWVHAGFVAGLVINNQIYINQLENQRRIRP